MRRFITLFLCLAAVCLGGVSAQQIKGDFNSVWVKDTKGNGALPGMYLRPGTQPVGWEASNVHQKVFLSVEQVLVTPDADRTGGDGFSVKMENQNVGAMGITSGAPGYVTLGTPWVFAIASLPDCDGGTIGGIEYSQRPDSLVGYYKRTIGSTGPENALLLAYLWKGTSVSTVRTNPSGGLASTATAQVQDQDLCILGKKEADSGDAVLIGKAEYDITTGLNEWTRISIPVEYYTDDTPEKMNIILSSANYWVRSEINAGNFLWADDVELVCNAELKMLKVGGVELKGFDPKVYEYQLPASKLDEEIVAEGYGATSSVDVQKTGNKIQIVVTDNTAKGEKSYTYTLTFEGEETVIQIPALPAACVYGQETDYVLASNNPGAIDIEYSDPSMLKIEDGKLKFLKAGTAAMVVSQEAGEGFTAFREEIKVEIAKAPLTVKLMDVTSKLARAATYAFEYEGLIPEDKELVAEDLSNVFSKVPQASGYNGSSKVSASTAMGTYPIRWTQVPEAPNYEITVDETEKTLTIGKGLATISCKLTRQAGAENPALTIEDLNFANVLSADRTYDSKKRIYNIKPEVIASGNASAVFKDVVPGPSSPVGNYLLTIICTLMSDKYDFEIAGENYLTVQAAAPTLEIVNFPDNVLYGDTIDIEVRTNNDVDPEFLYSEQLPTGMTDYNVSFTGSKMVAVGAGKAKIEVKVKASGPYLETTVVKEFEVQRRPLMVVAGRYTRDEGEVNPEFSLEYRGFAFDEDESVFETLPVGTTTADEESTFGEYNVTVEGGEATNYEIVPYSGKLIVMTTPVVELVNFPETVTYGDIFDIEYQITNHATGGSNAVFHEREVEDVTNVRFTTSSLPEMRAIGAGPARIELVLEPFLDFFHRASVVKDFVIEKAPLTVTAVDTMRYIGQQNPEFKLTYEGFKLDDPGYSGVFIDYPSATTDADENSPEGFYTITVNPGSARNYAIVPVNGQLEVRKPTGINAPEMGNIKVYSGEGFISVKGNETGEIIYVYDTLGALITSSNRTDFVVEGLAPNSIYIVRAGGKAIRVRVK